MHHSICLRMFSGILCSGTCPGPSFITYTVTIPGNLQAAHALEYSAGKLQRVARSTQQGLRLDHADTHLHILLPGASRELALSEELCELRLVIGICIQSQVC